MLGIFYLISKIYLFLLKMNEVKYIHREKALLVEACLLINSYTY